MLNEMLLTHACGPYPQYGAADTMYSVYASRFTKGQDVFNTTDGRRRYIPSVHLLAQNVKIPVTVLEYPTLKDFRKEISKQYAYIGINHNVVHTAMILKMCREIREVSPNSIIILGGCGTMCLPEIFANDDDRKKYVDYISEGEGIRFLRTLFKQSPDDPIEQRMPGGEILAGIGCTNRCEFCNTSAYFKGRYTQIAEAPDIFKYMKENYRLAPIMPVIFDDNFLQNKKTVVELGTLIGGDSEYGLKTLAYTSFGSADAVARYSPEELALSGVGKIWIGVESLFSKLKKLSGIDLKSLFATLHACGIETTGSWIVGFDYQNPGNISRDVDYYVSLGATYNQVASLVAGPGTALWERYKREKRLPSGIPWINYTHYDYFNAAHFTDREMREIINSTYRKLYQRWGSSFLRKLTIHLNGMTFCEEAKHPLLKNDRRIFHKKLCVELFCYLKANEIFAPNDFVRSFVREEYDRYIKLCGKPTVAQKKRSDELVVFFLKKKMKRMFFKSTNRPEPFRRYRYPNNGKLYKGRPFLN